MMPLPSDSRYDVRASEDVGNDYSDTRLVSLRNNCSLTNQDIARSFSFNDYVAVGGRAGGNPETNVKVFSPGRFAYIRPAVREKTDYKLCEPSRYERHSTAKEMSRRQSTFVAGCNPPVAGLGQVFRSENDYACSRQIFEQVQDSGIAPQKTIKDFEQVRRANISATSMRAIPFLFPQASLAFSPFQGSVTLELSAVEQSCIERLFCSRKIEERIAKRRDVGKAVQFSIGLRTGVVDVASNVQFRQTECIEQYRSVKWQDGEAPFVLCGIQQIVERYYGCNILMLNRSWAREEVFGVEYKHFLPSKNYTFEPSSLAHLASEREQQPPTHISLELNMVDLYVHNLSVKVPRNSRDFRLFHSQADTRGGDFGPSLFDFLFTDYRSLAFKRRQSFDLTVTVPKAATAPICLKETYRSMRQSTKILSSGLHVLVEAEVVKECTAHETLDDPSERTLTLRPKKLNYFAIRVEIRQPIAPTADSHQDQLNLLKALIAVQKPSSEEDALPQSAPGRLYSIIITPTSAELSRLFSRLMNEAAYIGALRSVSLSPKLVAQLSLQLRSAQGSEEKMASLLAAFCRAGGIEAVKFIRGLSGDAMTANAQLLDQIAHLKIEAAGQISSSKHEARSCRYRNRIDGVSAESCRYRNRIDGVSAEHWLAHHNADISEVIKASSTRLADPMLKRFYGGLRPKSPQVNPDSSVMRAGLRDAKSLHETMIRSLKDSRPDGPWSFVQGQLTDLHLSETPLAAKELVAAMILNEDIDLVLKAFMKEGDGLKKLRLYAYGENVLREIAAQPEFCEGWRKENEVLTHNAYLALSLAKTGGALPNGSAILQARGELIKETHDAMRKGTIRLSDIVAFVVQNVCQCVALGVTWEVVMMYLRLRLEIWKNIDAKEFNFLAA